MQSNEFTIRFIIAAFILGNPGVTHSVPTAYPGVTHSVPTALHCSGYGMGHAWVTEDELRWLGVGAGEGFPIPEPSRIIFVALFIPDESSGTILRSFQHSYTDAQTVAASADLESFVRGGPALTFFFWGGG